MKASIFIAALVVVAAAALPSGAQAQNYPWCAYYGGRGGGGTNCGFSTFAQCMAAVSGTGGFCNRNTQYVPPAGPRPRYRRHRHYD